MSVSLRKIDFPSVVAAAYRGGISSIRTHMLDWAAWIERSPGAKVDILNQVQAFVAALKGTGVLLLNSALVTATDATVVVAGSSTGSLAVSAGAVGLLQLPGTAKIVKSATFYAGPAVTGSYASGYTFTIVNGVITAIVAS